MQAVTWINGCLAGALDNGIPRRIPEGRKSKTRISLDEEATHRRGNNDTEIEVDSRGPRRQQEVNHQGQARGLARSQAPGGSAGLACC